MLIALHTKYLTRLSNLGSAESEREKLEDRAMWKAALFRKSLFTQRWVGAGSSKQARHGRIVREPPVSGGRGLLNFHILAHYKKKN